MADKHKQGTDGILEDGVSHYPATASDLLEFSRAAGELSRLAAPALATRDDPHTHCFRHLAGGQLAKSPLYDCPPVP